MSDPTGSPSGATGQQRTLAIRMSEHQRAQLDIIANLAGRSVSAEILLALDHWIDRAKADPKLLAKAEQARAEIEREAQTRRGAIASLFDQAEVDASASSESTDGEAENKPQAGRRGKSSSG